VFLRKLRVLQMHDERERRCCGFRGAISKWAAWSLTGMARTGLPASLAAHDVLV
jgi:hypothetical protein